jgi:hypothetical protein
MSRLAAFSFESVTSATAEIYAQIKKAIGTGPNTFAAIAGIGTDEFLNQRWRWCSILNQSSSRRRSKSFCNSACQKQTPDEIKKRDRLATVSLSRFPAFPALFRWLFLDPVAALCNGNDPDWRRYICGTEERCIGLVIGEILIDAPERVLG